MSITPGQWNYTNVTVTPGAGWNGMSSALHADVVTALANGIAAGSAGTWAAGTAEQMTGAGSGARVLLTGPGGATIMFFSASTAVINAASVDAAVGAQHILAASWNPGPPSVIAANTNWSSTPHFTDPLDHRFSLFFSGISGTTPLLFHFAWQGANVWMATQFSSSTTAQWGNAVLAGPDIIEQTVHPGDTYRAAQIRFGADNASNLNSNHSTSGALCAQVRSADNSNRVIGGFAFAPLVSPTRQLQTSASWFLTDIWVVRDAGDLATTGVVPNNGVKGRIARGAAMMGPSGVSNKVRVGPAESMMVHTNNGLCLGWDENATAGIP